MLGSAAALLLPTIETDHAQHDECDRLQWPQQRREARGRRLSGSRERIGYELMASNAIKNALRRSPPRAALSPESGTATGGPEPGRPMRPPPATVDPNRQGRYYVSNVPMESAGTRIAAHTDIRHSADAVARRRARKPLGLASDIDEWQHAEPRIRMAR